MSPEDMSELIFHELTHLYGTVDDDSRGDLLNAHTIDGTIRDGSTVSGNPIYKFDKRTVSEQQP
jgi:hypothetical protein